MKKNIMFGFISVVMIFALAGLVSAAASLSVPTDVRLGSENQERNLTTTERICDNSFTITNNGNVTLTNLLVSTNAESKFAVTFSQDTVNFNKTITIASLAVGETKTINVRGIIPQSQSSNSNYPTSKNIAIGSIIIANSDITSTISNFYISPMSELSIKSVKFVYGGEEEGISRGNSHSFDYKGDRDFTINFEAKNSFPSGSDIDIEDVQYTVTIENIDDDDLEKDFDDSRIGSGKTKDKSISFTLPANIDSGSYQVRIEADGQDSNGAMHYYKWYGDLKFDKQSYYVKIQSASVSPSVLKCSNAATVTVSVANLGESDEDHAAVTVNSSNLGISSGEAFALSSETSSSSSKKTLTFPVKIANVAPGTYTFGVNAYSGDGKLWTDYKSLDITVQACDGSTTTTTNPVTTTPTTTNTTIIQYITNPSTGSGGQLIAQPVQESSFMESTGFIVLLALGVLIVFIVIIVLLVKLVK